MSMHPDLEWLASHVSEWPIGYASCDVVVDESVLPYGRRVEYKKGGEWSFFDWQLARDACLESTMTPEEEALPAKEHKRTAESFLKQAAELMKERGKQYDQDGGERSMGKAVEAFNAITGRDLSESEGWLLMGLLKSVRQYSGDYHRDSAEGRHEKTTAQLIEIAKGWRV